MSGFVHLLVQSDATFLDSTCRVTLEKSLSDGQQLHTTLVAAAVAAGMKALALTDRHGLFQIPAFCQSAEAAGLQPIIGCQLNHSPLRKATVPTAVPDFRILLLAANQEGLRHLNVLSTLAWQNYHPKSGPLLEPRLLANKTAGLIGIVGGLYCEPRHHLHQKNPTAARQVIQELASYFTAGDFYLALQRVGAEDEEEFNHFLQAVARQENLPLTVIHDVRYVNSEDAEAHDVLRCIATNTQLENEDRQRLPSDQFYLKTPQEMRVLFADEPQLLETTAQIAQRCKARIPFGQLLYPAYPLQKEQDAFTLLRELCYKALPQRYPEAFNGTKEASQKREKLTERLDYELRVLQTTGFVSYFLIVWDLIDYARRHNIPVGPGRGSAAGSLVAYLLQITDVDPFRFGLIFERFLNPERISPPDIDIDFCPEGRAKVIEYVRQKYGADRVAQIITFSTLGAKAAVRDVTRVLGLPYSLGDRIAKLIPNQPLGTTLSQAVQNNPELSLLREQNPDVDRILQLALKIEGLIRQSGIHAAGVIIADRPLTDYVPLARAEDGSLVCQYDMNAITEIGLLKMDFLGLKTLSVINQAETLIQANHQRTIDWKKIPDNDPATFELLNQGKTVGVFQLESPGMRELCRKFQPQSIDDIIALIALYRPGPMDLIPDFIRRRHGQVEVFYEHPALEPICADTYGILIYQEQVMQAANVLAGYTLGGSDILRRAMGKKDAEKMAKERQRFIEGCARHNGIPPQQAERIFQLLEKFAGYGFNKSHSAAYGVLSYRTAWLKANYPAEFLCALLNNEIGSKIEKIAGFCLEAETFGIRVLPPDVNYSYAEFTTEGGNIRYGLAAIKNVSASAVKALVEERIRNGPYSSLEELTRRNDPNLLNKRCLESLNYAGALDCLGGTRLQRHKEIHQVLAAATTAHRDTTRGQGCLFVELPTSAKQNAPVSSTTNAPPQQWSAEEILAYEREHTGLYFSGHPMDAFKTLVTKFSLTNSAELSDTPPGTVLRVAGILNDVRRIPTRSGKVLLRATLEDTTGTVDLSVPPFAVQDFAQQLKEKAAVLVTGLVEDPSERGLERPSLRPLEVVPLEQACRKFLRYIRLHLPPHPDWEALDQFLRRFPGRIRTQITLPHPYIVDHVVVLQLDDTFRLCDSDEARQACATLLGPEAWEDIPDPNPPLPEPPRIRTAQRNTPAMVVPSS